MNMLKRFLKRGIHKGRLSVRGPDGEVETIEGDAPGPSLSVHLKDPSLAWKIPLNPELAVGEAYMDGRLVLEDGGDLRDLFSLYFQNKYYFDHMPSQLLWHRAQMKLKRFLQHNPVARARANARHHYNIGNALYWLFLDEDMQYSCGYFETGSETLEEAQTAKKRHIAAKLCLADGQRVLDIGCGWGGLALYLASIADIKVVGITLSEEQIKIARARAEAAGLSDRVSFRLVDYREVNETFNRIVSVGMLEHVGAPYLDAYFRSVREHLDPDGVALIHSISSIEPPGVTGAFLAKYIFPGGYSPSLSEVYGAVERIGLWPLDTEIWRKHYAFTLHEWRKRCAAQKAKIIALYDERFYRMWDFYLAASEAAFLESSSHVFQIQLGRRRAAVPLTRTYIAEESARIRYLEPEILPRLAGATAEVFKSCGVD